jgi:hypothetical protein
MATFEEIREVRLRIDDPPGLINIVEVAALPATASPQTGYRLTTDNLYYSTEGLTGLTSSDYEILELMVSDDRISGWIDDDDIDSATCRALKQIINKVGKELTLVRISAGADTTQYTSLKDTYEYYKGILADCTDNKRTNDNNSTGRIGCTIPPVIAGGEV